MAEASPDRVAPAAPGRREAAPRLPLARIFRLWLPLAASWLLMGAELPMFTAFVARMADPAIHLAAYGAVVFPVALLIEAPVIMLLAASTALCTDWDSYRKVRRFMLGLAGGLTAVHVAVAFTPLYDFVARVLIKAPAEVIEPARLGLRIMTPWTAAIAYRRFQQGVLIRFERARLVGVGTAARLGVLTAVLAACHALGGVPGIVAGTSAVAAAVVSEALFIGWCVQPVLRARVRPAPPPQRPLTRARFLRFYLPLALTPLIYTINRPLASAAMNRMPLALQSLACLPAAHGLVFLARSVGMGYNEVVVALLGEPGAARQLLRFARRLAAGTMTVLALVALTPLAHVWFGAVSGLPAGLVDISSNAVMLAILLPALQAVQSWFQGILVFQHRTRAVFEATAVYLAVLSVCLLAGVALQPATGIYAAMVAFVVGMACQTAWLRWRCRGLLILRAARARG